MRRELADCVVKDLAGTLYPEIIAGSPDRACACATASAEYARKVLAPHPSTIAAIFIIAQLAHVTAFSVFPFRPSEKNVTGGLHQALAGDYPLSVIGVRPLARVRFEYRSPRFLDLEKEGIVVRGHEQSDGTLRTNASHPRRP